MPAPTASVAPARSQQRGLRAATNFELQLQKFLAARPRSTLMVSAAYLPVFCASCCRAFLRQLQAGMAARCPSCGTPTVVLPGETYSAADVALFDRIEPEVREASLSRRAAEHIVAELRDVPLRSEAPESVLLRIMDFVPGLHFLIPALDLQPTAAMERALLVRATGMVQTVVSARLRAS